MGLRLFRAENKRNVRHIIYSVMSYELVFALSRTNSWTTKVALSNVVGIDATM